MSCQELYPKNFWNQKASQIKKRYVQKASEFWKLYYLDLKKKKIKTNQDFRIDSGWDNHWSTQFSANFCHFPLVLATFPNFFLNSLLKSLIPSKTFLHPHDQPPRLPSSFSDHQCHRRSPPSFLLRLSFLLFFRPHLLPFSSTLHSVFTPTHHLPPLTILFPHLYYLSSQQSGHHTTV